MLNIMLSVRYYFMSLDIYYLILLSWHSYEVMYQLSLWQTDTVIERSADDLLGYRPVKFQRRNSRNEQGKLS